jgi:hypothetical protein
VLRPADFPFGWKADPTWQNGSPLALFGALCKGVDPNLSDTTVVGSWSSRHDLVERTNAQIVEHVSILFAATRDAKAMIARLVVPWATRCMAVGKKNGTMTIASSRAFHPDAGAAEAHGFHFLTVAKGGPVTRAYADAVFLRVGSGVSMFIFLRNSEPPDPALERRLLRRVAARMA